MASIDDGEIFLMIEDASAADLRRGITAARASFETSGVSPAEAFIAAHEREMLFDLENPPPVGANHNRHFQAFEDAIEAAIVASGVSNDTPMELGLYTDLQRYGVDLAEPHYELRSDPNQPSLLP